MNQKKAKKLRKEVRNLPVSENTVYKPYQNSQHLTKLDEHGVVYHNKMEGIPRVMEVCQRSVYQGMK